MLIYNHKKEFIGIDENDLKTLGFSDLADLLHEVADFADLFTKSVGYIHNFKHVHWIDYIACDDSGIKQKVIIGAKNKNFVASLDIQTIYLSSSPSQKAYIINLLNIKALVDSQNEQIKAESPLVKPILKTETPTSIKATQSYDSKQVSHESDLNIDKDIHIKSDEDISPSINIDISELTQDDKKDMSLEESKTLRQTTLQQNQINQTDDNIDEFANYKFNPKAASEALGLPVDLIEEFIQDFISQANSFKSELYQAAHDKDINKLKTLSHKLKGVAANLRIEDVLSILTSIGMLDEHDNMEIILNKLYKALDKLSGKEIYNSPLAQTDKKSSNLDEDDFVLSLKDEEPLLFKNDKAKGVIIDIDDSQVPDTIEIAELADDDFYKQYKETTEDNISDEELLILNTTPKENNSDIEKEVLDIAISYDKELVANSIGLDADSFNKLLGEYIETSNQLCQNIIISTKNGDFNSSKENAKELKGMSDNMRINRFDNELNTIIKSNDSEEIIKNIDAIMIKLHQISDTKGK